MGTDIRQLNFNSKHYDKCKFALKLIPLVTTFNLLSLEVVQISNIVYFEKTRIVNIISVYLMTSD